MHRCAVGQDPVHLSANPVGSRRCMRPARASACAHARSFGARTMTNQGTTALIERIEATAAKYPNQKSAIIPALHLAQEHFGWLPPEAFEAVAEALDTTP